MPAETKVGPYVTPEELKALDDRVVALEQAEPPIPPEPVDNTEKLFVATNGNNSNLGDMDHPFRDIKEALKHIGPNISINIRAGTYAEEIAYPKGGSEAEPAYIRAYGDEIVTLKPPTGSGRCFTFASKLDAYLIVEDLFLDGKNVQYDVVKLTYSGTDKTNGAHHIKMRRCELFNAVGQGILLTAESHHNEFEDLYVHDCGGTSDLAHGLYIGGPDNVFRRIEIARCAGSALQNYNSYGSYANNNLYDDLYCHDCQTGGPQKRPMFSLASGSNVKVTNSRFIGGQYAQRGVDFMGSCVDFEIKGGYISGFPENGILIEPGAQRTKVTNVGFGQNGTNVRNQGTGSVITGPTGRRAR